MKNYHFQKQANCSPLSFKGSALFDLLLHPFAERKEPTKKIVALLPVIAIFLFAFTKYYLSGFVAKFLPSTDVYRWLVREDGIVEDLQFVAYFISFLFAFSLSRLFFTTQRKVYGILYLILCLGLFYIAMEEISWGQRIFHFKTPDSLMQQNYQKEFNTHNLRGTWRYVHGAYILMGLYGAFGRFFLPNRFKDRQIFAPDACLTFYFLPVSILYFYYDYITPVERNLFGEHFIYRRFIHDYDQEAAELLLAFGFLLFLTLNKYRQAARQTLPTAGQTS